MPARFALQRPGAASSSRPPTTAGRGNLVPSPRASRSRRADCAPSAPSSLAAASLPSGWASRTPSPQRAAPSPSPTRSRCRSTPSWPAGWTWAGAGSAGARACVSSTARGASWTPSDGSQARPSTAVRPRVGWLPRRSRRRLIRARRACRRAAWRTGHRRRTARRRSDSRTRAHRGCTRPRPRH